MSHASPCLACPPRAPGRPGAVVREDRRTGTAPARGLMPGASVAAFVPEREGTVIADAWHTAAIPLTYCTRAGPGGRAAAQPQRRALAASRRGRAQLGHSTGTATTASSPLGPRRMMTDRTHERAAAGGGPYRRAQVPGPTRSFIVRTSARSRVIASFEVGACEHQIVLARSFVIAEKFAGVRTIPSTSGLRKLALNPDPQCPVAVPAEGCWNAIREEFWASKSGGVCFVHKGAVLNSQDIVGTRDRFAAVLYTDEQVVVGIRNDVLDGRFSVFNKRIGDVIGPIDESHE